MGETRVDLLHLLEDLREAYPGPAEETILTEIVANSLDSGATAIALTTDPVERAFTLVDDGLGMRRRELARYHDLATSTKARGEGIGFAGVGIKIALLVAREVLTETRRNQSHVATTWALTSRHRAPWRWIAPPGFVTARGTAVRLVLDNPLSPLLDPGFIEGALTRHFQPLLDPSFDEILAGHYPRGVRFFVNGHALARAHAAAGETASFHIKLTRKRKASASGYLVRDPGPLPEDGRGVGISTFGKVIKRGWDWLGLTPTTADRIAGLIEAPALAECLTLNKSDFVRAGARGALYLAYRKAIQEAVSRQLAQWGDGGEAQPPELRRAPRPLVKDLEAVLTDLADAFPLLSSLLEQRAGGQRTLAMPGGKSVAHAVVSGPPLSPEAHGEGTPASEPGPPSQTGVVETGTDTAAVWEPRSIGHLLSPRAGPRRRGHYGLNIQFESRPDDPEPGRLVESTIWVNESHAAYRRAVASRSEAYHLALAAALALAPLAVEPSKEHAFVIAFLTSWGGAIERKKSSAMRRKHR